MYGYRRSSREVKVNLGVEVKDKQATLLAIRRFKSTEDVIELCRELSRCKENGNGNGNE